MSLSVLINSYEPRQKLIKPSSSYQTRSFSSFSCADHISSAADVILEPTKHGQNNIGLIFIPGAELPPDRYVPLLKQLQQTSSNTLWIGIPSFLGNLPFEQVRPQVIEEMLRQLYKTILPRDAKIFLSGHSLAVKHLNEILGQILISSFLERNYGSMSIRTILILR